MPELPSGQNGYPQQQTPSAERSENNGHRFAMEQILAKARTATLVKIKAVKSKGEVDAPGMVDVQPLVKMMDGKGNAFSHGVVNNVLYYRVQAGKMAIIMDPKVDDIGFLVVADSDISSVKSSKKESNPGSFRKNGLPDGVFFPALLGDKPTSYLQFMDDGTIVLSPDSGDTKVTVKKARVEIENSSLIIILSEENKIYLGKDHVTHAVMTSDGPSEKVFCVINESK